MWSDAVLITILCIFTIAAIVVVAGLCWFWKKRKSKQRNSTPIRYHHSSPSCHSVEADDPRLDHDDPSQRMIDGTVNIQNGVSKVTDLNPSVCKDSNTNRRGIPPSDECDSTDLNGTGIRGQTEASVYEQQNQTTGEIPTAGAMPSTSAVRVDHGGGNLTGNASTNTPTAADTPEELRFSFDFPVPDPSGKLERVTGLRPVENTSISLQAKS